MKILPRALFASLLGAVTSFAGGFGGPPPFSNDSPLQSGTDGTYQASVSGTNLSGIIRFAYENGSQTLIPNQNTWVVVTNGIVYRGNVDTTMAESNITGVLDSASVTFPGLDDGSITLPVIFVIPGQRASGDFKASIDFENPFGQFNGKGKLSGSAGDTLNFVTVSENSSGLFASNSVSGVAVDSTNIVLSNSTSLGTNYFKVRGVRTSTSAGGGSLSTNSTN